MQKDSQHGDREAASNVRRRAERLGTLPPNIDAARVGLALADARDRNHLTKLLIDEGIEAEFDRRGQTQSVYGWRLRRLGSQEWLKASTLSRDLSWPKIAHRFQIEHNTDLADLKKETFNEARLKEDSTNDLAHAKEQDRDRRPAMIRSSLQPRPKVDIDLPKTTKNITQADIGPVSKVMLLIGVAALKLSAAAIEALLNFIKRLLQKFGLMLKPALPGSAQAQTALPFESNFLDVESRVIPDPIDLPDIKNAATELTKVANALEQNDPDLLPQGEGRDELAASMMADKIEDFADSEIKFNSDQNSNLDELFSKPSMPITSLLLTQNEIIASAMSEFKKAATELRSIEKHVDNAPKVIANEVYSIQEKLRVTKKSLEDREKEHWVQKGQAPRLLKFAFPSLESFCAKETAAVSALKKSLAAAEEKHPAQVPKNLASVLLEARLHCFLKAKAASNEQKKLLTTFKNGDPSLLKLAQARISAFSSTIQYFNYHPSANLAEEALKTGFSAINEIAKKQREIEERARFEVQKEHEASLQKDVPQNNSDGSYENERPRG